MYQEASPRDIMETNKVTNDVDKDSFQEDVRDGEDEDGREYPVDNKAQTPALAVLSSNKTLSAKKSEHTSTASR